jgi:hypothetical protein
MPMPDEPSDTDYRARSEHYARLAELATEPLRRAAYLQLAAGYRALAASSAASTTSNQVGRAAADCA